MNAYLRRRGMERIRENTVEEDGHLIWKGTDVYGVPMVSIHHKQYPVRRMLWWEKHGGEYPKSRLMNRCGVKACVDPDHCSFSDWQQRRAPKMNRAQRAARDAEMIAFRQRFPNISYKGIGRRFGLKHDRVQVILRAAR